MNTTPASIEAELVAAGLVADVRPRTEVATAGNAKRVDHGSVHYYVTGVAMPSDTQLQKSGMDRRQLQQEVGFRRRRFLQIPPEEPSAVMGHDEHACAAAVSALATVATQTYLIPSAADTRLVRLPAYPFVPSPSPYLFVPIIARHVNQPSVIWELGPAWVSSALIPANQLGHVLFQLEAPAADGRLRQLVDDVRPVSEQPNARAGYTSVPTGVEPTLDVLQPALVLVALPMLADRHSVSTCVSAQRATGTERGPSPQASFRRWARPTTADIQSEHVEFSNDLASYKRAVISRLSSLRDVVAGGTKVAVAVPNVNGLPSVVELVIKRAFTHWQLLERRYAFEDGNNVHAGNGSPICGVTLTVWGAR